MKTRRLLLDNKCCWMHASWSVEMQHTLCGHMDCTLHCVMLHLVFAPLNTRGVHCNILYIEKTNMVLVNTKLYHVTGYPKL